MAHRAPLHKRAWFKSIGVLAIGILLGISAGIAADQLYRNYLVTRVHTLAQAFDVPKVQSLTTNLTYTTGPSYTEVREKLTTIREINPDVRFVYLMAKNQQDVYFVADSEPESSADHSTNGETYDDATPALKTLFTNGGILIEGPVQDDWGTWISALAPIIDPTTKKVVAVVGLDVPALQYTSLVVAAVVAPILLAIVLIAFMSINGNIRRRRVETLRFRSELVSIASHELRTPLTGIRWASQMLQADTLTHPQSVLVSSIHDSVVNLEESIDDILQLASIENIAKMKHERTDMTNLLEEIFATQKLPAQQKSVTIAFADDWPAQPPMVRCDPIRMRRVFSNLISNAVKYSRKNTEVTIHYLVSEGRHCIKIVDKGIGIPHEEKEKVFSGFYRASNAIKTEVGGTGMGLYLSKAVVEQHCGALTVDSIENEGTTVCVLLPM